MKICYFGDYQSNYPRHRVLQSGLQQAGADIYSCRLEQTGLKKYWEIFKKVRSLPSDTDIILVAYSNSRFVWFLRLCTRKPIVWNAFYSLYQNWVFDRKRVNTGPGAWRLWFLDYICCRAADHIILETEADCKYFQKTFDLFPEKFTRIFVGYDEDAFRPKPVAHMIGGIFTVEFHGRYIPLQGVPTIIKAAKLLEEHSDIHFNVIGEGQTYQEVRELASKLKVTNVEFVPFQPMEKLAEYMTEADVCIGLLGDVDRVNQCIPNKVYEASGMRRASINADTDAIRELFVDSESIVLIERGNAEQLAAKILMLRDDPKLKERIANAAYVAVHERANVSVLGQELYASLQKNFG